MAGTGTARRLFPSLRLGAALLPFVDQTGRARRPARAGASLTGAVARTVQSSTITRCKSAPSDSTVVFARLAAEDWEAAMGKSLAARKDEERRDARGAARRLASMHVVASVRVPEGRPAVPGRAEGRQRRGPRKKPALPSRQQRPAVLRATAPAGGTRGPRCGRTAAKPGSAGGCVSAGGRGPDGAAAMADALVRQIAVRVLDPVLDMDWSQLEFKIMREGTVRLKDVNLKKDFVRKIIPEGAPMHIEDVSVRSGELDVKWTLGKAITAFLGSHTDIPATLTLYGVTIDLVIDLDAEAAAAAAAATVADAAAKGGSAATGDPTGDAEATEDDGWSPGPDEGQEGSGGRGAGSRAVAVMSALGGGRFAEAGKITVDGEADDEAVASLPRDPQLWRTLEAAQQEARQVQEARMTRYDKQPASAASATQRLTATAMRILEQSAVVVLRDLRINVRYVSGAAAAPFEAALSVDSVVLDASQPPPAFTEAVKGLERRARHFWTRTLSVTGLAVSLTPLQAADSMAATASLVGAMSRRAKVARLRAAKAAALRLNSAKVGRERAAAAGGGAGAVKWGPGTGVIPGGAGGESGLAGELWAAGEGEDEIGAPVVDGESTDDDDDDDDDSDRGGDGANAAAAHAGGARVRGTRRRGLGHRRGEDETGSGRGGGDMDEEAEARSPLASRARADRRTLTPRRSSSSADTGELREEDLLVPAPAPAGHDEADAWDILRKTTLRVSATRQVGPIDSAAHPAEVSAEAHIGVLEMRLHERQAECLVAFADDVKAWKAKATSGGDDNGSGSSSGRDAAVARPSQIRASGSGAEGDTAEGASQGGSVGHGPSGKRRQAVPDPQGPASLRGLSASADTVLMAEYSALARRFFWRPSVARCVPKVARVDAILRRLESVVVPPFTPEPFVVVTAKPLSPLEAGSLLRRSSWAASRAISGVTTAPQPRSVPQAGRRPAAALPVPPSRSVYRLALVKLVRPSPRPACFLDKTEEADPDNWGNSDSDGDLDFEGADDGTLGDSSDYGDGSREHNGEGDGDEDGELVGGPDDDDGGEQLRGHSRGRHRRAGGGRGAASGRGGRRAEAEARLADRQAAAMHSLRRMHRLEQALAARGGKASIVACRTIAEEELRAEFRARYQRQIMQAALASSRGLVCGGDAQRHEEYSVSLSASLSAEADASAAMARLMREQSSALGPEARTGAQTKASGPAGMVALPLVSWCALRGDFLQAMSASGARGGGAASAAAADAIVNRALMRASADDLAGVVFACPQLMLSAGDAAVPGRGGIPGARVAASAAAAAATVAMSAASSGWARLATGKTPPPSAAASPIASGRSGHSDDESGAASAAPSSDGSAGEEAQPHDSGPVEPPQPRSFRWLRDTAKFRWRALRRFQRATTAGRLEAVRSLRQELEVDLAPVVAAVRVAQCAVADSPALARALALPAQRLGSADRASLPSRRSRAAGSTARSRPTDSSAADRGWKMPQQWPVLGAAVRGRIDGGAPAAASAGAAASVGPWAGGVLARQGGVPWLAEAGTDDSSFVLPRAAAAALYASRFRSLAARGHSDLPDGYQRYAFQLSVSHAGAEIVSRAGTPLARLAVDSVSLGASDRKDACRDLYLAVGRVNVTADPGIDAEASSGLGRSLVRALSAVAVMRPRAIQAPRLSAEHCGGGEPRDEPEHGSARRSSGLSATRSTAGSLAGSEAGRRVAQDNRLSPTWGGGGRQAPPQAGSRLLEGAVGGKGSTLPTVARGVRVWAGTTTAAELAASAARAIFGCGTAAWVQSLADPGLALAGDSWSSLDREVGRALRMAGLSHTRGGFRDHARWVAIARELDAAEELTVPGSEARETAAHARRLDLPLHHLALAGDGPPTPPGSRSDSNGRTRGGGHGRRGRAKQAEDATPSSASEVLPAGARSAWRVLQHATAKFFESVPSLRAMLLDEDICAAMVAFARARAEALLADPEVEAKDCEGPLGLHPLTADGGRWAGLVDAGSELRVDLIKPAVGNAQAVSSLGSGRGALGAAAGDGDGRFVPSPGFAGGAAAAASAGGGGGGSRRLAALKVVEAAVYPRSRALDGGFRTPSLAAPELQASRFVESVTNRMDEPRRGCLRGPGSFGGLPSVPSVRRREAVLNISSPVSQTPIPGPDSRLAGASAARWNRWLLASVGAELVLLARHLETCLSNTDPADLIAVAQTMLRSRFLRRSAAAGAMVPSRFYIHIEALVPHTRPPQPDAAGAVAALPAPGALHSRPGSSTTAVAWTLSRLRSGLAFLAAGSDDEMDVDGRRASATAGVAATSEGGAPAMAGGTARESGVRELRQLLELLAAFTMELIDIAVAAPFLDSQWCPFARAFAWRAAAVDRPLTPSLPRVEVLRALQGRFAFLDRKRRELLARVAFGVQEALMAAASRAPGHGGRGGARAAARPQSPGALGSPGEPAPHGSASQATAAAAAAASFGQGKGRAGSEAGAADSSPPSKSAAHSAADGSRETFLDDADRVMVAADATRAAKLLRSRSVSSRQWDVGTGAAATSRLWSAGYLGTLGLRSRGSLLDGTSLHPLMEQAVEDGAGVMHPAESLLLGRASEPGSLPVYTMRHVLLVRASTSGQAGGVLDEGDPDDVMVGAVLPRLMAAETVALAGLPAAMAATAANSGHVESASADRLHQAAVDAIHAVADGDVPWTYRALRSAAIDAAGCAAKESVTVADLDEQLGRVAEAAVAQASATTDMESAGWAARSQHWQEGQEAASSAKDRLRELPRQLSALPEGGTCLAQGKFRMAILHEAADDEASLAGGLLGRVADWVPVHVEVDSSGKWLRCYRSRSTTRAEATAKAPISAGVMVLSGEALAARGGRPAKNPAATGFGGLWGSAPAVSSEVVANNGMCIMDPPAMSDGAMRALLLVADTVEERERWCGLLRACVQADEAERAMTEDSLLREVAAQRIARETDSGPPGHGAEGGGGSGDTHGILATLSRLGGAPPTLRPGYGAELARRDWQLSAGDWRRTRQAVVRVRLAPTAVTLCPGLFASALAFARRIHIERLVRPASDASDPGNASSGSVGDESGTGKLASVAMLVSRTKASTKRHRGAGSRPDVANLSSLFGADASGEEGSKRGDEIAPERGAGHAVRAGSHAQLLQGPLGTIAEEEADAPERRSGSLRRPGRPERRQPDWLGLSAGDGGALSDGSSVDSDSEDDDALVLDAADSQPGSTKKGQAAAAKASGKGHLVLSLVMDRFQFAVGAVENTAAEQRAAKRDAQGGVPSSGPAEDLDDPASLPRRAKEAGPRFTGVRLVVSSIALVTSTSSKGVRGRVNTKGRAAWDGHGLSQVVEAVGRSAPHSALAAALSAAQGFPPGSAAVEAEASVPPWQPPSQGAFRSAAAERPPGAPDDGELIDGIRVSAGGARRPDHVGTGKQSGDASAALASWAVGGTQAASKPLAVPSFCLRIGSVRAQALAASGDDRPGAANVVPAGALASDWLAGCSVLWCTQLLSAGPIVGELCASEANWPQARSSATLGPSSASQRLPTQPTGDGAPREHPSRRAPARPERADPPRAVRAAPPKQPADAKAAAPPPGSGHRVMSRDSIFRHAQAMMSAGPDSHNCHAQARTAWLWVRRVELRVGLGSLAPLVRVARRWLELRRHLSREAAALLGIQPANPSQVAKGPTRLPAPRRQAARPLDRSDLLLTVARFSVGSIQLVVEGEGSGEDRRASRLKVRLPASLFRARAAVRAAAASADGAAPDPDGESVQASAETDHAFRELFRASAHRLAVLAVQLPASVGLARRSDGGTALIALPPAVPGALPRKGDRALLASVGQLQAWEPARWVESRYAAVWPRLSAPEHAVSRGRCIFVGDVSRSGEDWDGGGDAEVEPPASSGRPGKQQAGLGRFASFSQGLTPAGGGQWPTGAHQLRASVAPKLRAWKSKAAAEVRLRGIRPLLAVSLVDASAPARPRPTRKRRFQLVAPPSPAEGDLGTGAASARRAADEVQRLVRSGLGSGEATGQAGKADARWPERVMRVHVSMGKLCLTPDLTTAAFAMQWAARAQAIASRLAPAAAAGAGVPEPKPGPAPAGSSLLVATVSLHAGVSVRLSAYNSPILHVSLLPARVRASVFTPATLRRDASVAGSRSTQLAADVNGISVVLCRSTDWFVRPIARAEAAHPSAASMRAAAPDPADADPWARLSPAQALARRVWLRRRLLRPAVSDLCAAGVHAAAPDRRLTDALFWSAGLVYDGVQDLEAVQHARDKSREAFEAAVEIAAAVQRDPFLCPAAVQAASAQAMPAVWSGVEGGVVRLAVERMRLELRQSAPPTEAAGELARDSMGGASASHDVESGTGLASDADDRSEDSSDQRPSPAGSPAEGAGSSAGDAKDGEATPEGPPARHRGTGRSDSSGGRASMEVSVALERLTLLVEPDPRGVPPGARRCLYHSDPGPEEERGAHHRSATSAADTWRRASAAALAAERQDSATGSPLRPGGGTGRRRGQHRPGAPSGSSVSGGGRRRRDGGVSSRRARASDSSTKRRRQGSSGATSGPQLASLPHEAAAGLHAAYRRWPLPPWRWVYGRASRDHTPRTMLRVGPLVPAGYAAAKKEEPLSGRGAHAASQRARRPPRRTAKDPAASGGWSSIVLARRRAMASTAPPFDRLPPEPATKWEAQPEEWGMCVGLVQAPSESWPASGDGYGLVAEVSAGDMDLTADPLCLMQLNQTVMLFRECLRCCEREAHPKAARRPFFATLVDERSSESPWSARSGFQGHRGMAPGAANRAGLATASFDAQAPTRRARQPPELPPDFDSEAVSRMLWASKAGDQRGGRYISVRVARAQVILCALADGARRVWTAVDLEAARRGPGPAALAGVGDVGMAGPGTGDDDMPPSGAAQFAGLRWLFAHPCTRGAVVDLMHAAAQRMEVEVTNLELPRLGSQQTTHLRMGPLLAVDTSPSPATVLTPRPEDDAVRALNQATARATGPIIGFASRAGCFKPSALVACTAPGPLLHPAWSRLLPLFAAMDMWGAGAGPGEGLGQVAGVESDPAPPRGDHAASSAARPMMPAAGHGAAGRPGGAGAEGAAVSSAGAAAASGQAHAEEAHWAHPQLPPWSAKDGCLLPRASLLLETCAVGMAAKAREELLRRRSEQLDARATQALADAEADARTEERLAFARLVGSGTSTTPPTGEPARPTSATPVSDSDAPGADGAASVASSQPHPAADAATVLSTDDLLADSDAQAATGGASPTLSSDPAGSAAPRASAEVLGAAKPSPLQPAPRLAEQAGVLGRLSVSFSVSQRDAAIVWTELAMPRLPTRMAALSALLRKDRSRGGEKSIAREDVLFALDTALPPRPPAKRAAGEGRAGAGPSAGAAHASPLPSAPTARDARFSATAFAAFSRRPGTDGVLLSLRDHVAATHEAEAASALPGHLRRAPAPSRSPMVLQDPSLSLDLPLSWCALDVYDARHDVSAPADPSLVLSGLLAAVARRAQLGSGVASDGSQGPPAPFGMHPEGIPPGLDGEATLSGAAGGAAAVGQPDGSAASLATPTTRAAATPSPSQHQGVRASSTVADASSVPGQGRASQGGAFGSADEGDGSSVERSLQQSSQVDEALARVAEAHAALEQQQALERRVLAVRAAGLPLWDDEVSEAQGALGMFADEEDEHAMRNLEAGAGASSLSSVVGLGSSGTMREMGVEGETLGLGIDPHARVDRGGFRASQPRTGVLGDAGARREASGAAVADEGNLRAREADVERREAAMDKAAQIVSSMAGESWMTLRRLETPIGLAAEAAGEDAGLGQSRGVDMVGAPQWARRRVARLGRAQLPPRGPGCDQQVVDRRRTIQIQLYMRDTRICYVPRFVNEVLAIQLATMEAAYGRTVWRLGDLPPPPMIGFSHVVMEARRLEVLVPPGSRADDPVLRTRMGSMSMEMSLESHSFEAAAASAAGSAIQSGRSLRRSRPTKAIDMQVLNVRSMTDVVVDQPPADELPLVPSTARGRAAESVSDHGFVMAIPWVSVSVTEPFGQLNKLACPLQRLMQVQISPASVTMTSAVPVLVNVQQSVMGAMRELSPTIRNASRPFAEHANLTMSSQQLGSGSGGGAASGGAGSTADSPGSVMQVTLREQVQPDRLPELREQPFPDDPFVLLPHRFFPDFACLAPAGLFSTRVPEGSAASAGEELCRRAQAHRLHRLAQRGAGEPDSPIPLFLSPDALATAASDAEAGGMAGHAALLGMSLSVLLGTPMERPPDQPDDDQLGLGSEWTASPARSAPGAPWVAESPPRSPHSQGRFALATSPAGGLGELAADPAGFLSRESALTSRSMLDSGADGSAQDQLAAITDELCQVGLQGAEVSALQGLASREGEAPGHLPSELAVSSTQASVLEAAAAALRRAMESSDAAGGASKALEAVARVAQLLEAAQGPARRTELAAEEQAAMLADQNAFLLGQLLGEQPAAPDE